MKAMITLIVAVALSLGAYAHEGDKWDEKYCVRMKDGKKTIIHQGITITKEVTLDNGIRIQPDGTIIRKDGSKTMLSEGECIDKSGNIAAENNKNPK
jgi:hypothetical protein